MAGIRLKDGRRITIPDDWTDEQIDFAVDAFMRENPLEPPNGLSDVPEVDRLSEQQAAQTAQNAALQNAPQDPGGFLQRLSTGVEVGSKGIARNIGVPFTNIDLEHLTQALGARPLEDAQAALANDPGSAGALGKFATELALTAPAGTAAVNYLRSLAPAASGIPAALSAGNTALGARTARAALQGATSAGLTGQGEPVEDLIYGAGAGILGDRIASGIGRVATGIAQAGSEAKNLLRHGIPVTPGQAVPDTNIGRIVRGMEEGATSIPFIGDIVAGLRGKGTEKLREKALAAALAPGANLPAHAGDQPLKALREIGDDLSARYTAVLSGGAAAPVPPGFVQSVVQQGLSNPDDYITPDRARHAAARIARAFSQQTMTPDQVFKGQSDLRNAARKLAESAAATAEDRAVASAYQRAANYVLDGLEQGLPNGADLQALRGPYRNYVNLAHEASKVKGFGETLTPTGIRRAAIKAGNRELENIARSAESVLPSRTPDSGTPKRLAQMAATGGLGGLLMGGPDAMLGGAAVGAGALLPGLLATTPQGARFLYGQYPWQPALANILRNTGAAAGGLLATE